MKLTIVLWSLATLAVVVPCSAQQSKMSHRHGFPDSPELFAQLALEGKARSAGEKALAAGDFTAAETDFREALQAAPAACDYYGLGEALTQQGRIGEAIQAYRAGIYGPPFTLKVLNDIPLHGQFNPSVRDCPGQAGAKAWMEYALLLSQTGQMAEAGVVYQKALPQVPNVDQQTISRFSLAGVSSPNEFQALTHIALGLCASVDSSARETAFGEFSKARQLQPDAAVTNYYYGYGWQKLGPAERAKFGNAQQAKVALEKAVKLGKPDVKEAAQKALLVAAKP